VLLEGDHTVTQAGRIKKPSVTLLCQWFTTVWQHMSPNMVVKVYIHHDTFWNNSREFEKGSSECKKLKELLVKMDILQKRKVERVTLIGECK
jgi:hypothetical protein